MLANQRRARRCLSLKWGSRSALQTSSGLVSFNDSRINMLTESLNKTTHLIFLDPFGDKYVSEVYVSFERLS